MVKFLWYMLLQQQRKIAINSEHENYFILEDEKNT